MSPFFLFNSSCFVYNFLQNKKIELRKYSEKRIKLLCKSWFSLEVFFLEKLFKHPHFVCFRGLKKTQKAIQNLLSVTFRCVIYVIRPWRKIQPVMIFLNFFYYFAFCITLFSGNIDAVQCIRTLIGRSFLKFQPAMTFIVFRTHLFTILRAEYPPLWSESKSCLTFIHWFFSEWAEKVKKFHNYSTFFSTIKFIFSETIGCNCLSKFSIHNFIVVKSYSYGQ